MEEQFETLTRLVDSLVAFAVAYGFQILGALVFLVIGLKVAGWMGRRIVQMCARRDLDPTLSAFIANIVRLVVLAVIVIITLGNFGISIAPLVALAGATVFGATLAIQGPLSNYGAGLSIILTRPFVVGNTVRVRNVSGVVDEITLASTRLIGEDGERIVVPNKQIVGEIIVNSGTNRIVEAQVCIAYEADADRAVACVRGAIEASPEAVAGLAPQVGVHDFSFAGIVLGMRYWVPSRAYFQSRYEVNRRVLAALVAAGVKLQPLARAAFIAEEPRPPAGGRGDGEEAPLSVGDG